MDGRPCDQFGPTQLADCFYGRIGCPGWLGVALVLTPTLHMRFLGIILTVTGIVAIVVTLMRGANLGMSRRSGLITGTMLLVLGVLFLIYAVVSQR